MPELLKQLFGTDWIDEPGSVWMAILRRGERGWELFHYTHWRYRSLFRGKVFKHE